MIVRGGLQLAAAIEHCALGNLITRLPLAVIAHEGGRPVIVLSSMEIADEAVPAFEILRQHPGAVIGVVFKRQGELAVFSEVQRVRGECAPVVVLAPSEAHEAHGQLIEELEIRAAGAGKIAINAEDTGRGGLRPTTGRRGGCRSFAVVGMLGRAMVNAHHLILNHGLDARITRRDFLKIYNA